MIIDSIFDSDCDAIVNTINTVGVMGGGLAKKFRQRYPRMNADYQSACAHNKIRVGRMWSWHDDDTQKWIINFPTKDDWRYASKIEYISDGLFDLGTVILDLQLTSLAIPALGCGLGGLNWLDVEPMIRFALENLAHNHVPPIRIDIYPPTGRKYTI